MRRCLISHVLAVLALPGLALADGFEIQRFHPASTQRLDYIAIESGATLAEGRWELGAMLHGADDGLVGEQDGRRVQTVLDSQLLLNLLGTYALTDRFQIAVDLPLYLLQNAGPEAAQSEIVDPVALDEGGIGDLRLTPKYTFFAREAGHGVGAAALMVVSLPTGDEAGLRGGSLRVEPQIAAEFVSPGGVGIATNAGFLFEQSGVIGGVEVGSRFTWGLGLRLPVLGDSLFGLAEFDGAITVEDGGLDSAETPLEGRLGWRLRIGDFFVSAGTGTGIIRAVGTPDFRVFAAIAYGPLPRPEPEPEPPVDPDTDGDGRPDSQDRCPNEPEDEDGFEDRDGCPDHDNDRDRIPDARDGCPNDAEDFDGDADDDGCPEEGSAILRPHTIEITERIQFAFDSAELLATSASVLDSVARILRAHPEILRIRVEGHTSTEGSDAHNQDLSERRAAAVVHALEVRGVTRARLESQGYGESRPRFTDETDEAHRELNRRVELHIVDRAPRPGAEE